MTLPIYLAARDFPDQIAWDDGKVRITYGQLRDELARSSVINADLKPGDQVVWCPRNDLDAFLTFWAILERGCVACPISHRFPEAIREEIRSRLAARWLRDPDAGPPSKPTPDDDRATIILSSGSTGVPKAIVHSMAAHVASAVGAAANMPLGPGDRWLWSLPLFHVSGLSILVRCAVAGATVVGMDSETKLSAAILEQQKVTHLSVVATQLRRLLSENDFPSRHLKAVLLGGGAVDVRTVNEARKRGVAVHTTYGLTEMASQVTTSTTQCDPETSGRVLSGRELKISNAGEILVRGEMLCLGYLEGAKIRSVVDDQGWFHTGDLGHLNSSKQLVVKGRIDNMFISGGENIHPESIELVMKNAFDIAQVIVVPKVDNTYGHRPVAYVQGELPDGWRDSLRTKLQAYEIPVAVLPWPADADGSIKPNRKQLQQIIAESHRA